MLVASVLSLKGGVGKTTVTLGLASAAAQRGVPTVIIDLDPQVNTTATLAPDAVDPRLNGSAAALHPSIAEVLSDPARKLIARSVRATGWGEAVRILPGSERTEAHNHPDPGSKRLYRLAGALEKIEPVPDLVLIDCPPSLGQLTRSALVAADRAVLVTEPSLFAVAGVQRALEAVQTERTTHRPALQPLGVVINRFRPRVAEHEYRLAELRGLFGPLVLDPVLPERSAVQQAQGAGVPIHEWPTTGAREIAAGFDVLLERLLRTRIGAPAGRAEARTSAGSARRTRPPGHRILHQVDENRGLSDHVVRLARRDRVRQPGLRGAPPPDPAAKNVAHSAYSGATTVINSQTLPRRPRTGRARAASSAAPARSAAR